LTNQGGEPGLRVTGILSRAIVCNIIREGIILVIKCVQMMHKEFSPWKVNVYSLDCFCHVLKTSTTETKFMKICVYTELPSHSGNNDQVGR